jgi:hypothetical protein
MGSSKTVKIAVTKNYEQLFFCYRMTYLISLDLVFFERCNILRICVCQPRNNNMNIAIKFTIAATYQYILDSITQPPASHCREFCTKM